jgi:hypothetical protein
LSFSSKEESKANDPKDEKDDAGGRGFGLSIAVDGSSFGDNWIIRVTFLELDRPFLLAKTG